MNRDGQHPYHYTKVHKMLARIRRDPEYLDHLVFSDESIFGETEIFNQQNHHYWAHDNPHLTVPIKGQYNRFSVNKWAGLLDDSVVNNFHSD